MIIGTIKALFRYPVKSMQGERVDRLEVGPFGAIGDRAYALRERVGRVVTAKRTTQLLDFSASYAATPTPSTVPPVTITLPDGQVLHSNDPEVAVALSSYLNRDVSLERWQPEQENFGELDAKTIFADVPLEQALAGKKRQLSSDADRYDLALGTFFDSAHLHLLTTGTLHHLNSFITL